MTVDGPNARPDRPSRRAGWTRTRVVASILLGASMTFLIVLWILTLATNDTPWPIDILGTAALVAAVVAINKLERAIR